MSEPRTFTWRRAYRNLEEPNSELARVGDELAKRLEYKRHRGLDAIMFFLIQEHHWLPSVLEELTVEDLRFLLLEEPEAQGWLFPEDWEDRRWAGLSDAAPSPSA